MKFGDVYKAVRTTGAGWAGSMVMYIGSDRVTHSILVIVRPHGTGRSDQTVTQTVYLDDPAVFRPVES